MEGFTGNAPTPVHGGDTFTVTGTVANLSGPTATQCQPALDLPAGWTATPPTTTAIGKPRPGCQSRP